MNIRAATAKYREAFCLRRAKDDPTDAQLALELLMTHRNKLTALYPQKRRHAHLAAVGGAAPRLCR